MNVLTPFRSEIDRIDDQIIDLLAQRFQVCRHVAHVKMQQGIAVRLPGRIEQVKQRCADRAAAQGVDHAFVLDLYDRIIEQTCRTEEAILDAAGSS